MKLLAAHYEQKLELAEQKLELAEKTTACAQSGDPSHCTAPPASKRSCPSKQPTKPIDELGTSERYARMSKITALLATVTAYVGGKTAFTAFIVGMVRKAVAKKGTWQKNVLVDPDIVSCMLDDQEIKASIEKEQAKRQISEIRSRHLPNKIRHFRILVHLPLMPPECRHRRL